MKSYTIEFNGTGEVMKNLCETDVAADIWVEDTLEQRGHCIDDLVSGEWDADGTTDSGEQRWRKLYWASEAKSLNDDGQNAICQLCKVGESAPVVTLTNGIRVANFSSPHTFVFDDGTVLPACSPERARSLMLEADERSTSRGKWTDIELSFETSIRVCVEIEELHDDRDIDIILVPLPVMEALKNDGGGIGKCRVCRVADRITKVVCSDKFCI